MNTRIEEIMKQCGDFSWCAGYVDDPVTDYQVFTPKKFIGAHDKFDLGKFAELLIQECVNVISTETIKKLNDNESLGNDDNYDAGVFAGSIYARVAIKQHFGIE